MKDTHKIERRFGMILDQMLLGRIVKDAACEVLREVLAWDLAESADAKRDAKGFV